MDCRSEFLAYRRYRPVRARRVDRLLSRAWRANGTSRWARPTQGRWPSTGESNHQHLQACAKMPLTIQKVDYQDPKQADALRTLINAYASDPMGGGEPIAPAVLAKLPAELEKFRQAFSLIAYVDKQPGRLQFAYPPDRTKAMSRLKGLPITVRHPCPMFPSLQTEM